MPDFVPAYDPGSKQMVRVPAAQAAQLKSSGYAVGPDAYTFAQNDGWGGAAKAFSEGILKGSTAGLSDLAMPADMAKGLQAAAEMHPVINGLAQAVGAGGAMLATGGLAPEVAVGARVLHSALAGGTEEIHRAQMANEPIAAEQVLHGIGLGGLFGLVGEGAGAALSATPKAAKGLLGLAAKAKEATGKAATEVAANGISSKVYSRSMPDLGFMDLVGAKHLSGGLLPISPIYTALKADRIITHALNDTATTNRILEQVMAPAAEALGATVRALTHAASEYSPPVQSNDIHKEYEQKKAVVEHIAMNPEGFADKVSDVLGPALQNHMPLHAGITAKALNAATALNEALPKDPFAPTAALTKFEPTRKQKEIFLHNYNTVTNFPEAMKFPTPASVMLAERTNPEQLGLLRNTLIGHLTEHGIAKLKPWQRRSISIILGVPTDPAQSADYLMRLQKNAVQQASQQPAPSGGGLGTKAAQAVTLRDMPGNIQLQMGL